MRKGNLFVISGPSGAGKGTLVASLVARSTDVWVSVSATTRQPRPGEVDGVHYDFMTVDQFQDILAEDGFLEWAEVHGNYYGTPLAPIQQRIAQGQQVILEIDVQGGMQVKDKVPDAHLIFIEPPSCEELERRLRGRGTETEEVIAKRMANARVELSYKKEYDYTLVNDDIERATAELLAVVDSYARI
jgi:guanylate kinase